MTTRIVSWVLIGVFTYAWFWVGYVWPYLNQEGAAWGMPYMLATVLAVVMLTRVPRATGTGLFDGIIHGLKNAPMIVAALAVVSIVAVAIHMGINNMFMFEPILQAVALAVGVGVTTALWYGALERA